MRIDLDVNPALLLARMDHGSHRLGFAVVNALNNTAKQVQADERAAQAKEFTIRTSTSRRFLERRGAKIAFASARDAKPFAEIFVDTTNLKGSPLLLPEYEAGGLRAPVKGKTAAVPVIGGPARPSFGEPVPSAFKFTALHLELARPKRGRKRRAPSHVPIPTSTAAQARRFGLHDTYQVPGVGVFQRESKTATRLVYGFVADEKLDSRLSFEATAQATAERWFPEYLQREMLDVFAHHGVPGP